MRTVLAFVMVAACAIPAPAGNNPDAGMYIDLGGSSPSGVTRVDPAMYSVFDIWICMAGCSDFYAASLKLNVTGDVPVPPSWWMICPGALPIPIDDADPLEGATFYCWECWEDETFPFLHGRIFYVGGSYDILIAEDAEHPRIVYDCQYPSGSDPYCVLSHGGVWKDPVPGDPGCGEVTPVESVRWSTLKALYR